MPQQHAAGHRGVQALGQIGHGDAHRPVAGVDGGIGQALALAADDHAQPAGEAPPHRVQIRRIAQCSRQAGHSPAPQLFQGSGQVLGLKHRHPHRGPMEARRVRGA